MTTVSEDKLILSSSPVIKVDGQDLRADILASLTSFRVEVGFCTVGRATLRFADEGYAISTEGALGIGKVVEITVYSHTQQKGSVVFSGEVVSVALEQGESWTPELVVVVDDKTHRLARTATTKTFQQMKASDVLKKLASAATLTAKVDSTTLTYPYLIQGGTDLDYLDQLAARSGLVWWCDYPGTLKVAKPDADGTTVDFKLGETGRSFSVRASARNVGDVEVTGWDPATLKQVAAKKPAVATDQSKFVQFRPKEFGASSLGRSDLAPLSGEEATALAQSLNDEAASQMVTARGTTLVDAALKPGVLVHVTGAGPATGRYRVTAVEHRYDERGFTSTFTAGPLRRVGLVDLVGGGATKPGLSIAGHQVGVVTAIGKKDGESDGEGIGMVKVKLTGLPGEPESTWARVLTVGGGKDRGMLFVPEVNDEVLVVFEAGDSRRPVVLGGLFSKKNAFPGTNPVGSSGVDARRIKSREGHVIELSDKSGDEFILLEHGKKKHTMKMGPQGIEITSKGDLTLKTDGGSLTIKSTGDIELKGNGKITVKATQDLAMEGMNLTAKASMNAQVEGGINMKVKGNAQTSLEGSGMTVVKGAMVKIN